jgi:hypothetical protein
MATATYTLAAGGVSTITGIHDRPAAVRDLGGGPGAVETTPTFACRTIDLDDNADRGDTLVVDGFSYIVRARLDDGTGITALLLDADA